MALSIKIKIDGAHELSVAHRCERNQGHQRGVNLFPMRPAKVRGIRVDTEHFHVAFDSQITGNSRQISVWGQLTAVSDACVSGVAFEISGAMSSSAGEELVRLRRYQIVLIRSSRYLLPIRVDRGNEASQTAAAKRTRIKANGSGIRCHHPHSQAEAPVTAFPCIQNYHRHGPDPRNFSSLLASGVRGEKEVTKLRAFP